MLGFIPKILTLSTHVPIPKLLLGIVMLLLLLLSPADAGGYPLHASRFSAATADTYSVLAGKRKDAPAND